MSRNKYLGKDLTKNELNIGINNKNIKSKETIFTSDINKTSEDNTIKITKKSKIKLDDEKIEEKEKEKDMKIIVEQNIEYNNKRNDLDNNNNIENVDNNENHKIKEDNSLIYEKRIKELEDTINKMGQEFSQEVEKHNDEINEKDV